MLIWGRPGPQWKQLEHASTFIGGECICEFIIWYCYWEVVAARDGSQSVRKQITGSMPWKAISCHWSLLPLSSLSCFSGFYEVRSFLPSCPSTGMFLFCHRPKREGTLQPWTENISQNMLFLLQKFLSGICHGNKRSDLYREPHLSFAKENKFKIAVILNVSVSWS